MILRATLRIGAWALAATAAAASPPTWLAIDVPTTLSGQNRQPNQVIAASAGSYLLETSFDPAVAIGALHRRADGSWLFSPAHPVTLGATTYEPRDVVRFDGSSYSLVLAGGAAGIPDDARIDALFEDAAGLVASLDVPATLGGVDREPSDLVRLPAFTLYWNAASAGVPRGANVVGADVDSAGRLVLAFDTPTTIAATTFLPGQLVAASVSGMTSYLLDPAWPAGTGLRDFAFAAPSGVVPDGNLVPGAPLRASAGIDRVILAWDPSCLTTDTDFEVYGGAIGTWYSHAPVFCSTGGVASAVLPMPSGDVYYLVVPRSGVGEGSYGRDSGGAETPPASVACLPQLVTSCP